MNHVPDAALAAVDRLGEGLLAGERPTIRASLRSDLRVVIRHDGPDGIVDARTARIEFHLDHGRPESTLAGYGSFVGTIVAGIETRLREWGMTPPAAYERVTDGTVDAAVDAPDATWRVYAGALDLGVAVGRDHHDR